MGGTGWARGSRGRVVLLAVGLHLLLVLVGWLGSGRDLAWFAHVGPESPVFEEFTRVLGDDVSVPLDDGHDGPMFWAVARDPLLLDDRTETLLDRPVHRARRIAYPALAAPWRVFGEQGLLLGMVVTNVAAVAVGTAMCVRLAERFGARRRAALAFALNPAIIVTVMFDLADAVAAAALLVAVVGALERRRGWLVAGAVVATLAREVSLLGLGGLALLAPGLRRNDRVLAVAAGTGAIGAWSLYAASRVPGGGDQPKEISLVPFGGWERSWRLAWSDGNVENAVLAGLVLLACATVVVLAVRRRDALVAVALPYALLFPFIDVAILSLPLNMVRAVTPVLTLLPLAIDKEPPPQEG